MPTRSPGELTLYTLATCDTCRRALKWLRAHQIEFVEHAIRETPPSADELRTMLAAHGRQRLFNTSGRDYGEMKMAEKLPGLGDAAVISLLAANGNLIKRPFLIGRGVALVGFDEKTWGEALGA